VKRSQPPNLFELEGLEQRILLSGDALSGAACPIAPEEADLFTTGSDAPPLEEPSAPAAQTTEGETHHDKMVYDPSQQLDGLFSGLSEEDPFSVANPDHAITKEKSRPFWKVSGSWPTWGGYSKILMCSAPLFP